MNALSVTPPESASPASAEHLVISIHGPPSPLVPGDTGTNIRSTNSSAANEDRGGSAAAAEDAGDRRKVLPEELCRNVVKLLCESTAEGGICEVYVIGTAHVSKGSKLEITKPQVNLSSVQRRSQGSKLESHELESCQDVQAVIRFLQPQVVFLELCLSRKALLFPQNLKADVMNSALPLFDMYEVASKLEVFPGSEFRVAYEEALHYGGMVKFGDRPVQLKEMDDIDMMTLENQEMSKQFPTLMETLVHERDQYMSATLLEVAREYRSVVAVVGKGHLQGIKKYWKQPVELERLLHVDMCSRTPVFSAVKLLVTVGVAVAGIYISKKYSLE
ncbi:hypothetical protein RHMOL_Rhmol04G0081200 [Rhododendron molle]|uniref:Uncharacterized protein n=1 Tax=Rhododendron molle TaxID=49168 RepID=A0ACC0NYM3_RHOML|nr:hypothetical protein RHMOL_Rhmol04G0081200 [Rhododendron molle]